MKTLRLFSLFTFMILLGMNTNLFAQDVIFLSNGNEIEAKITNVSDTNIEYKKWNNQDGPTYNEKTSNIFLIKYQNGEKDFFNNTKSVTQNKTFIGINAGFGPTYLWRFVYFSATGGIDLAFPIGNNFAIGPYLSAGYDWCDETIIGNFGALAIVGENNNIKFMIGQGANFQPEWECWGTSTRIGFTLPNNRIYLLGEFSTVLDYGELWSYSFLFHIGFNLGK